MPPGDVKGRSSSAEHQRMQRTKQKLEASKGITVARLSWPLNVERPVHFLQLRLQGQHTWAAAAQTGALVFNCSILNRAKTLVIY